MGLEEELEEMERKIEKQGKIIEEQSFAFEILSDYKKQNKRLFWIWGITFLAFIGALCYIIYILNDTAVVETDTIDVKDVETIDNSNIKIGDDLWEE